MPGFFHTQGNTVGRIFLAFGRAMVPSVVGLGLFMCAACGSSTETHVPSSITLTAPTGEKIFGMAVGSKVTLKVQVSDVSGNAVDRPPISFVSRAPQVVAVDAQGAVTGTATGTTFVLATTQSGTRVLSDSVKITVAAPTASRQ